MLHLTPKEAEAQDYVIDKTVYPWRGTRPISTGGFTSCVVWTELEALAIEALSPASRVIARLIGLAEDIQRVGGPEAFRRVSDVAARLQAEAHAMSQPVTNDAPARSIAKE